MRHYLYFLGLIIFASPPAASEAAINTCPLCSCPVPPPGCICTPFYCPPSFTRAGFDTGGDIEPGDFVVGASVTVQIFANANATIFYNDPPPVSVESLFPPSSPPDTFNEDVRTFMSSYSCYPNVAEPVDVCPLNLLPGGTVVTPTFLMVQWSPDDSIPDSGSYVLFRLALQQTEGLGPLTLTPTQFPVASVSGYVVFDNSGDVSINYTVYRLPANHCPCLGDTNWDGLRDGRDIAIFMDCMMGDDPSCTCADVDLNGSVDDGDIEGFVDSLLDGDDCF